MPTLPIPLGTFNLTGGDISVTTVADVIAEFPATIRRIAVAPVRDAFAAGWAQGFLRYQNIAARAAGQSDPLQATREYLRSFAEERSVIPFPGEDDESVRERLFATPKIVTPEAITQGINARLAPYSDIECTFCELELDGVFAHDGAPENTWDCFVGCDPDYPDRYYADIPYLTPFGYVPSNGLLRHFLIRLPPLEAEDETITYVLDDDEDGAFVGDGSDISGAESDGSVALSVFEDPKLAEEIYSSIVGYVESVKGHGITWSLVVEPTLGLA